MNPFRPNPVRKKRLPRKRDKPRRHRPALFFKPPKQETWPEISKRVRLTWWIVADGYLLCGICGERITDFNDLVPDHIEPGKMGGCRDHSDENLQPAHWLCNLQKGSKRMDNQELIARSGDRLDSMVAQNFPQVLIDMEVQHLAKLLAIEVSRKVAS